jgi:sialate O-acetylesterase
MTVLAWTALSAVAALPVAVAAQDLESVLNLRGAWKFMVGDHMAWADPRTRDADWDEIRVPSTWEDQGYPGYNGYAWYRKHFHLNRNLRGIQLYVRVGYVDDVCEVYVNGRLIGFEGRFPPDFSTAYNITRAYILPEAYLNYGGDNVIAVRVYDQRLGGGLTRGSIGLFEWKDPIRLDHELAGRWKFRTGDDPSWADPGLSAKGWVEVNVPRYWETEGFRDYDGYAWYRLEFEVPPRLANEELVLLLGKIDDFDETYVNGELIGRTGRMRKNWDSKDWGSEYGRSRAYAIPTGLLRPGKMNTLAVRVLDVHMHGGIYDGPVGLITRERFGERKKDRSFRWNWLDWFR